MLFVAAAHFRILYYNCRRLVQDSSNTAALFPTAVSIHRIKKSKSEKILFKQHCLSNCNQNMITI